LKQLDPVSNVERLASLPALPRDPRGPVFSQPWQAQAFALAVNLSELGHTSAEKSGPRRWLKR
jgi:hypothetical protein